MVYLANHTPRKQKYIFYILLPTGLQQFPSMSHMLLPSTITERNVINIRLSSGNIAVCIYYHLSNGFHWNIIINLVIILKEEKNKIKEYYIPILVVYITIHLH